jgi:hypothetical protein
VGGGGSGEWGEGRGALICSCFTSGWLPHLRVWFRLKSLLGRPLAGRASKGCWQMALPAPLCTSHIPVGRAHPLEIPARPGPVAPLRGVPCGTRKIRVRETGDFRPQPRACMRVSFRPVKAALCLVGLHPCPVSKMSGPSGPARLLACKRSLRRSKLRFAFSAFAPSAHPAG